jgi:hypothetical protein
MNASGLDASFVFLPNCPVEELPQHLAEYRPEILHFAAHGEDGNDGGRARGLLGTPGVSALRRVQCQQRFGRGRPCQSA